MADKLRISPVKGDTTFDLVELPIGNLDSLLVTALCSVLVGKLAKMQSDGCDQSDAACQLSGLIDDSVDFEKLLPPKVGEVVEAVDKELFAIFLTWLLGLPAIVGGWLSGLKRTPKELREDADKKEAKGRTRRASKLRSKADKREEENEGETSS